MRFFKIILIFLFCLGESSVFAQNFEITPSYISETGNDTSVFDMVLHSKVKRILLGRTLNMRWVRIRNVDTSKWDNLICDNIQCWGPVRDSSDFTMNKDSIADTTARLDAHFRAHVFHTDSVKLMVFEINARDKAQIVTYVYSLKTVGIVENKNKAVLKKAYPNPVRDNFFIELEEGNYINTIEIYSTTGNKLHSFNPLQNSCVLNLSFLDRGSYLLKITDIKKQTIIKPVIKY